MEEMMTSTDRAKSGRVMNVLLEMKKLDLAALQKAYDA
jgi:predicted 3-demethylubiquinone-9 3-methyltransferase (glyoxalase superfamily)